MTRQERKIVRFREGSEAMNADERKAVEVALTAALMLRQDSAKMVKLITDIPAARGRAVARRESDRRTDANRRILVGARVPRELYERVRKCAGFLGVSLYRFVVVALETKCRSVENITDW